MPKVTSARSIRIVHVAQRLPDPHWTRRAHSHDFNELLAPTGGQIKVVIDGRLCTAGAGDVVMYKPGAIHAETSDPADPVSHYCVAFDHPKLMPNLPEKLSDPRGRVAILASWILAEQPFSSPARGAVALGLLEAMVAEINRIAGETPEPDFLARARKRMSADLTAALSLDDIAAGANMSKYHFVRRFHAVTGRTPMEELRLLRLERVKSLILTTDLPLKSIAPLAGLANEYHLSRLFRKHFGYPPGVLRGR